MKQNKFIGLLFFVLTANGLQAQKNKKPISNNNLQGSLWSADKANGWYSAHKWITGANYMPANAINQLEMWQAKSFNPATIDKELEWTQSIGFNTVRVFLHSVAWKQDTELWMTKGHVVNEITVTGK